MAFRQLVITCITLLLSLSVMVEHSNGKGIPPGNNLQEPSASLKELAGSYLNKYSLSDEFDFKEPVPADSPILQNDNGVFDLVEGKPADLNADPYILPVLPYTDRAVVLMYHHVDPNPMGQSTITPNSFKQQMEYLRNEGYNVIPLDQLCRFLDGDGTLPPKAVVITFDDGYRSFYKYAFPILKEYNFHATNFIIVADTEAALPPGHLEHLSWDEMLEMQRSGLVSFGSHTYNLHNYVPVNQAGITKPALTARIYDPETGMTESEEGYERRITADLLSSKKILEEHLGTVIDTFTFPYGASNAQAVRLARMVGFKYMFGVTQGIVQSGDDITKLRRVNGGNPKVTVPLLAASMGNVVIESMINAPSVLYAQLQPKKLIINQ